MADSYLEFVRVNRDSIDKLLDTLDIQYIEREEQEEPVGGYFSGKNIVLTGKMREARGVVKSRLETLGAKVLSQVTKNSDILIAGEKAGSKLKRAKELGIEILSEDEFYRIV